MKTVVFNGVTYRRYAGRNYYSPNGTERRRGTGDLHIEVWKSSHGPIPTGMHVHHIDHDLDNNDITNLTLLDAAEHARLHMSESIQSRQEGLARWRATEGGKDTLRNNAAKMRIRSPEREVMCKNNDCDQVFTTTHPTKLFCSSECANTWDRQKAAKVCPICGEQFRYKPTGKRTPKTCSYSCGWELRKRKF